MIRSAVISLCLISATCYAISVGSPQWAALWVGESTGASAAFSPSDIAGLTAWYDANDAATIALAGTNVTTVLDKSGNGYHLGLGNANPVYLSSAVQNGKNGLYFYNASGGYLISTNGGNFAITGSMSRTVFIVSKNIASIAGATYLVSWGSATSARLNGLTDEYYIRCSGTTRGYTDQLTVGTARVWSVVGNGTTLGDYSAYFDGGSVAIPTATLNNTTTLNTDPSAIALGNYLVSPNNGIVGEIYEVIIYDSALSDANRESVRDYLNTKWGVY